MNNKPQIGIWWDNGTKIVAFMRQPGRPEPLTGLCDSDDSHNDLWPEAAMQFGVGPDAEYFSIPRGRVLWDPQQKISIIYHGNATGADRLKKIANEFGLVKWKTQRDIHYSMGKLADSMFDD